MIAIHDLVKRYGEFTAVDGVTLEAKAGEIHGFLDTTSPTRRRRRNGRSGSFRTARSSTKS